MLKNSILQKFIYVCSGVILITVSFLFTRLEVKAVNFPHINVSFDTADESVIVDGIPAGSSDGLIEYQLEGFLNYESERIDTFCYAPNVRAYDVADKMAYIFNWSGDKERFLPCTGDYKFTTYVTARYKDAQGKMIEEKGPKTTISITLHKKDESTNWGSGLPNTTVEIYDLNQIKGKDKTIRIEEADYTWTIHGKDIVNVPKNNLSLKITANPDSFQNIGVDDYFGDTLALKMNIEHNGEFGFQAILDYRVGEQYAGKYANLFYVVGDGNFEYIEEDIVEENGMASFLFSHASDYIIAITDVEYTGQKLNVSITDKVEEPQTDNLTSNEVIPKKGMDTAGESSEVQNESDAEKVYDDLNIQDDNKFNVESSENQAESQEQQEEIYAQSNVDEINFRGNRSWIIISCMVVITVIIIVIMRIKKKR